MRTPISCARNSIALFLRLFETAATFQILASIGSQAYALRRSHKVRKSKFVPSETSESPPLVAIFSTNAGWERQPLAGRNYVDLRRSSTHHQLAGHVLPLLAPRATRLCQAKAKSASNKAPMPTGAIRKPQDMSLTTTTNGSIPAGG